MSRVGKTLIELPAEVIFEEKAGTVTVKGPKGTLSLKLPIGFQTQVEQNRVTLVIKKVQSQTNSMHGLYRSLLNNYILGVTKGWEKTVELIGVGYKAQGDGAEVTLAVGFTHPVKITAPKDITFKIIDNTKIIISGIDKKVVGEVAAQIRAVKPPEPYKGKGIRYVGEFVRKNKPESGLRLRGL